MWFYSFSSDTFKYIWKKYLSSLFPENIEGLNAIDLGCGDNLPVLEMRKLGFEAIGVDLKNTSADLMLDLSKPFSIKEEFDLVYCSHSVIPISKRKYFWEFIRNQTRENSVIVLSEVLDERLTMEEINNELKNFKRIYRKELNPIPFLWRSSDIAFDIVWKNTDNLLYNLLIFRRKGNDSK